MSEWIDREAALSALGIRAQTLYAYVSRGRIGMRPDPADPRRSLYRSDDIAALTSRRARGRRPASIAASTIAWGEPAIATNIATVHHGRLIYRGRDAIVLAEHATLEETAALLWGEPHAPMLSGDADDQGDPFLALAGMIHGSPPMADRAPALLCRDAASVIGVLAHALGAGRGDAPVHLRLAETWSLGTEAIDGVRRALVLFADHELNASTFAVRVAASTGASMAASLLAGLGALSGPRHGGAGEAVMALVDDADRTDPVAAISRWIARGERLPGFGHPLYPSGDARASALLGNLPSDPLFTALREAAAEAIGALPNIDFALAALTRAYGLPRDAPFRLFALGRSVGWAAHAMEQAATGQLIRPRAHYEGAYPA
jgi:citrate synthase